MSPYFVPTQGITAACLSGIQHCHGHIEIEMSPHSSLSLVKLEAPDNKKGYFFHRFSIGFIVSLDLDWAILAHEYALI